jgi:hypothetical protein
VEAVNRTRTRLHVSQVNGAASLSVVSADLGSDGFMYTSWFRDTAILTDRLGGCDAIYSPETPLLHVVLFSFLTNTFR